MEFGLQGTSRVCRGRHGVVSIVEFGLKQVSKTWMYIVHVKDITHALITLAIRIVFRH